MSFPALWRVLLAVNIVNDKKSSEAWRCTHKYFHLLVKPVVHDERMTHTYTRRLHPAKLLRTTNIL